MKKLLLTTITFIIVLVSFGQILETDILPEAFKINKSREFCSDGDVMHAIVYDTDHHKYSYLKITNKNYEFIDNIPYALGGGKTYGMEIFDNNCYHLTRKEGVRIYKQNGIWNSLTKYNGLHSGSIYGLYKETNKLYVISKDTLNYFDGYAWNYLYFDTDNDYVKIQKYKEKIYFFGDLGLYSFDGNNLDLLIPKSNIYSFNIFEDKLYVSLSTQFNSSEKDLSIYNIDGSPSSVNLNYPISEETTACSLNDTLYILGNYGTISKGLCIKNDEIVQIQHLTNSYKACKKINRFKNGVMARTFEGKLIYINPSNYDDFASLQFDKTYRNLDINQVDAYYMHKGQMFWDNIEKARYEVPKGSGKTSIFAGGCMVFWLGRIG